METDASFEASLRQLETTVKALEGGELGLDAALARYESGIKLLARCHSLLDDAGHKVALLTGVDETGQAATEPFDATATFEAPSRTKPNRDDVDLNGLPF